MNRLKKDKITKADLEGPKFKLHKGTCRNSIELEYHMEHCPLGLLTIPVDFFFNNDLEYLKTGNKERKYVTSVTKTKAARYDLKYIEDMILKEIVVKRAYLKEYTLKEADFSSLHLNDIEDLFLLYVQHKIHNLTGDEIVHLVNTLHMFTRSIIIQRREPYTIFYELRGFVYLNKSKQKRLIRADELYQFSDCTLKSVCDILHDMLNNFVLGYNHAMPKRAWTNKDQQRSDEMLKLIDNMLLERRIMRSLKCYVGGRTNEMDYRLRLRTI
ncbi:hypothetical protein Tco_1316928 [Tanacetum coccineum]